MTACFSQPDIDQAPCVAKAEGLDADLLRARVAEGRIVLPMNRNRKANPVGIGMGLQTKVNASIGTSTDIVDLDAEIRKANSIPLFLLRMR